MDKPIQIFDTTLRDGEQVPGCKLNMDQKVEIAVALEDLGVNVIEAGFPISSPGDFESVQAICRTVNDPVVCALSRAVEKDIEVAGEAIRYAKRGRIHTGIGTSDSHIYQKLHSTPEKILERAVWAVKIARKYTDDIEFYAEDAGRTDNAFLAKVVEAVIAAGATVVNIPDTTGYCLPDEYGQKIQYLVDNVKGIENAIISTHCHNDLGLATANSISGVLHGARQIECTINGIGERAGNTSLEEVVMIMRQHKDLGYSTNINPRLLCSMSSLVSQMMNMPVQPNKAIVGSNAFAHSSGIHQDGVIKSRETYEIIDPMEVGAHESKIVLTARSGRAALRFRANRLGYDFDQNLLNQLYTEFLEVADQKKEVLDDDIHFIMAKHSVELASI